MRKKATNEDVARIIKQCTQEVNEEFECKLFVAESSMINAERKLIESFSEEQLVLYKQFLEKRQLYYDVVFQKHKALK